MGTVRVEAVQSLAVDAAPRGGAISMFRICLQGEEKPKARRHHQRGPIGYTNNAQHCMV